VGGVTRGGREVGKLPKYCQLSRDRFLHMHISSNLDFQPQKYMMFSHTASLTTSDSGALDNGQVLIRGN
jgi:hypothetical protein